MRAYGFLGGAFDPIHNGHIGLLVQVRQRLPFTKLFFMPYGISPTSKKLHTTSHQRTEMIAAVVEDMDGVAMETCELEDKEPSWTVKTARKLRRQYGGEVHLSLLLGMDSYASLQTWRHWEDINDSVAMVIVNRGENRRAASLRRWEKERQVPPEEFFHHGAGKVLHLNIPFVDVSSSDLRRKLRRGEDISHLLPASVRRYIRENRLYQ